MNALRYISIATAALLAVSVSPGAESPARYEAVFVDGARIEGRVVSGWGSHPGKPRLDDIELMDAKRPLRWLRDRTLKAWPHSPKYSYIEFVGGDRIVGRIDGVSDGDGLYAPAHLLVRPAAPIRQPATDSSALVRVLPGRIERVVLRSDSPRRLNPGALYRTDGTKTPFVSLRWKNESVVLLLANGSREIETADISEIHMPRINPWKAYYRELAVLSPACGSRMMRIETTAGLIATSSSLRFGAVAYATEAQKQAADAQLKRAAQELKNIESRRNQMRLQLDRAARNYRELLAEAEKQNAADQQQYRNTLSDLHKRVAEAEETDPDELARQLAQFDKESKAAYKAMEKQLSKERPDQREKKLRAFRRRREHLRKRREKMLTDQQKKDRAKEKAQRELEQFVRIGEQRLNNQIKSRQHKTDSAKRAMDAENKRWTAFIAASKSVRARYDALRSGGGGTWIHIVQPVWSLDPLWVPFARIRGRWSFDPARVPLCRIRPESTMSPPFLAGRTNRSWTGGMLLGSGNSYAWGFAVHAYSELRFPLPQCAKAFGSRIALARVVGPGGCVRARVFVGSTSGKPAYESPLLIGSQRTIDTGSVRTPAPNDGPRLLVLQADPASNDAPPGADPSNIRDKLNWLDPHIELDRDKLRREVRDQVGPLLAACPGWTVKLDPKGDYAWTSVFYEEGRPGQRSFWPMLQARNKPLSLTRKTTIGPDSQWLAVHLGLPTDIRHKPRTVILRVNGREIPARKIPVRQLWRDRPAPLAFPLEQYKGKKVTLEIIQPAGGEPIHWQAVSMSSIPPGEYHLVDVLKAVGGKDMQVPHELGLALQSKLVSMSEKVAAVKISEMGGIVNFRPPASDKDPAQTLVNVMVGREWKGGDKTFAEALATFKKMGGLKTLLVTEESGVSREAIAKLKKELPALEISRIIPRTPSISKGRYTPVTWRNLTRRKVIIIWVSEDGTLKFSSTPSLEAGQERKRSAYIGVRYEAHYWHADHPNARDYFYRQPLSRFTMTSGGVWEIKPGAK